MRDDRRTRGRELLAEWECAQLALCELRGLSAQQLSPLRLWLLLAKLALVLGPVQIYCYEVVVVR